jgi:superfamily II RNA helicase
MNHPFELDTFQKEACDAIDNNKHVLATAHTGSGKTVIAIHGIKRAISNNKKALYVSPIKALSNQKYYEFCNFFDTGIITGDIKVKPDSSLIVITAEILRNSLLNSTMIKEWSFNMREISCIILDEMHYINDKSRGHVWEDIIIHLGTNIQLICLSATISDPLSICKWINDITSVECKIVSTIKRPVPLLYSVWIYDGYLSLMKEDKWKDNIWARNKHTSTDTKRLVYNCIRTLDIRNMTPAVFFVLSKSVISKYVKQLPYYFVNAEERIEIERIWNYHMRPYKNIYGNYEEYQLLYYCILRGFAFHHASMIPILKEIVEIIYAEGYIKILFATETFSIGLNMPTRSVVFTSLFKPSSDTKRLLTTEEFQQMAGRAGRRGKDSLGHVIILPADNVRESEIKKLITSKPAKIDSKLYITPQSILKHQSTDYKEFLKKSLFMSQYTSTNLIDQQLDILSSYLTNIGFDKNSIYGNIAKNIDECNPFMLIKTVESWDSEIKFPQICAECTSLLPDSGEGNIIIHKDITEWFISKSVQNFLPYPYDEEWNYYTGLYETIVDWASGKPWTELTMTRQFSFGSFIKIIYRTLSIIQSVEMIATELKMPYILNEIYGYQEKLLRDGVINTSLYIRDN